MYIAEAKCLMSHQYPNGAIPNGPIPNGECSKRRRAWQQSRTLNKHVDDGEIVGRRKERKDSFRFK